MAVNLFPRFNGQSINLDGRSRTLDGSPGDGDYQIIFVINPRLVQPGTGSQAWVQVTRAGVPMPGVEVEFHSSNPSVAPVGSSAFTNTAGEIRFEVVAGAVGVSDIIASVTVGGVTLNSLPMTITVAAVVPPEAYDATGYGQVELTFEPAISSALIPKVQRLSHQDQTRRYPGDRGLEYVASFENREVVFFPKWMTP